MNQHLLERFSDASGLVFPTKGANLTIEDIISGKVDEGLPERYESVNEDSKNAHYRLILPEETESSVAAFTEFKFENISPVIFCRNVKKIPIPTKFEYQIQNFETSFLSGRVSKEEIESFCGELSLGMNSGVLEKTNFWNKLSKYLRTGVITTFLVCFILAILGFFLGKYILFTVVICIALASMFLGLGMIDPCFQRKVRSIAFRELKKIVMDNQRRFLKQGVLVRPGHCGAFLFFTYINPSRIPFH